MHLTANDLEVIEAALHEFTWCVNKDQQSRLCKLLIKIRKYRMKGNDIENITTNGTANSQENVRHPRPENQSHPGISEKSFASESEGSLRSEDH